MVCNGLVHVALDRGITSILRLSVLSILDGSVENSSLLVVRASNKVIVDGVLSIQSINIHALEGCQAILAFDEVFIIMFLKFKLLFVVQMAILFKLNKRGFVN